MNSQLESLVYYIKFLASQGCEENALRLQNGEHVRTLLEDNCRYISPLYNRNHWKESYAPVPVGEIDIDAHLVNALDRVFGQTPVVDAVPNHQSLLDRYYQRLLPKVGNEDAGHMMGDVSAIWSRVSHVLNRPENGNRAYGLAVGRVQSGKTQNYIGLMLKAIDEGFNTIFLLTSKSNLLATQTYDRVQARLNEVGQAFTPLSVRNDNGGLTWLINNNSWNPNGVNVGIALKEHQHIGWIKDWLHHNTANLPLMKLLIIDDESDNATPDGHQSGGFVVNNEDDVAALAFVLDQMNESTAADWVREVGLGEDDLDEIQKAALKVLCAQTTAQSLITAMSHSDEVLKALHFMRADNTWEEVGNQRLFTRVLNENTFCRNCPRGTHTLVCARGLLAFLRYLSDTRPVHSVINSAMRVIAGRPRPEEANNAEFEHPFLYNKLVYIGYTATPYANMLNEDTLRDPLAPDFIKSLSVSEKYMGFDRVFGPQMTGTSRMPIVQEICVSDPNDEDQILENVNDIDPDDDITYGEELKVTIPGSAALNGGQSQTVVWKSLQDAVAWLLCSAAARSVYRRAIEDTIEKEKRSIRWTTMILNVSEEMPVHAKLRKIVPRYLAARTATPEMKNSFVQSVLALWSTLKMRFTTEMFQTVCGNRYPAEPTAYPSDGAIAENVRWLVDHIGQNVRVAVLNSDNDKEIAADADAYGNDDLLPGADIAWVVIGGNVIARGLTLEGLTVSYFNRMRSSTAVDTLTQMCRWFGYREGYELLPRIWMKRDTCLEMQRICSTENMMHHRLGRLFDTYHNEYDDDGNLVSSRPLSPLMDRSEFAVIACYGRRLSGRDAAMVLIPPPGLRSTSDIFDDFRRDVHVQALGAACEFASRIHADATVEKWQQPVNDHAYSKRYHAFTYYRSVSFRTISDFLERMSAFYPAGSDSKEHVRRFREEVGQAACDWDVVFGDPDTNMTLSVGALPFSIHYRKSAPEIKDNGASFKFAKGHRTGTAFFTTLPLSIVNGGECDMVEEYYRFGWLNRLSEKLRQSDSPLSIPAEIARVRTNPLSQLDTQIREHSKLNFSKYPSDAYIASVFNYEQKFNRGAWHKPVLLIDFVCSSLNPEAQEIYPLVSFFWPGHGGENYMVAVTGGTVKDGPEHADVRELLVASDAPVVAVGGANPSSAAPLQPVVVAPPVVDVVEELTRFMVDSLNACTLMYQHEAKRCICRKYAAMNNEEECPDPIMNEVLGRLPVANEGILGESGHTILGYSRFGKVFCAPAVHGAIQTIRTQYVQDFEVRVRNALLQLAMKAFSGSDLPATSVEAFLELLKKRHLEGVFNRESIEQIVWPRYRELFHVDTHPAIDVLPGERLGWEEQHSTDHDPFDDPNIQSALNTVGIPEPNVRPYL